MKNKITQFFLATLIALPVFGNEHDYSYTEYTQSAYHLDLTGANFEGARILSMSFGAANLSNAILRNADFSGVNLNFAKLTKADLRGTDLREIKYNSNTDWKGAIYSVHTQWPEGFDPQAAGAVLVEENQYADLKYAKFSDELVFTQDQLNILRKVGYEWGEELVIKGAMDQDTDGFHDIYGWAKPFEISENEETGIRELFWDNKEDKSTRYRRIFWKTKNPLQVGDILLTRYSYLDGMVKENVDSGGGAWLSKEEINRGTLSDEHSEGISGDLPYKHRFMLFQITGLNERFPDRIHLSFNGNLAPEGIRLAQWSVRKLITGDSDCDGVNDAEQILVLGDDPVGNPPPLDAPDENPVSDRIHYRKEWEKALLKLSELSDAHRNVERELQGKNSRIDELVGKIAEARLELDGLQNLHEECMTGKNSLADDFEDKKQKLNLTKERVGDLVIQLADSHNKEDSLALEITSRMEMMTKKTLELERLSAMLSVPHLCEWHYTSEKGWLWTDKEHFPMVYRDESKSWNYYCQGTSMPWAYFNFDSEQWEEWNKE